MKIWLRINNSDRKKMRRGTHRQVLSGLFDVSGRVSKKYKISTVERVR